MAEQVELVIYSAVQEISYLEKDHVQVIDPVELIVSSLGVEIDHVDKENECSDVHPVGQVGSFVLEMGDECCARSFCLKIVRRMGMANDVSR